MQSTEMVDPESASNNTDGNIPRDSSRTVVIPIELGDLLNFLQLNEDIRNIREDGDLLNVKNFISSSNSFEITLNRCSSSFRMTTLSTSMLRPVNEPCLVYDCYGELNSCLFGCWTPDTTLQTLVITNGQYKMTVCGKPKIACMDSKNRILDIFIPERVERIGWIETDGAVADSSRVYVSGTPFSFVIKNHTDYETPLQVTVEDSDKQQVALARATSWTQKSSGAIVSINKVQFLMGNFDTQTKAVLFAFFGAMMFDYKEDSSINNKFIYLGALISIGLTFIGISFL